MLLYLKLKEQTKNPFMAEDFLTNYSYLKVYIGDFDVTNCLKAAVLFIIVSQAFSLDLICELINQRGVFNFE